MSGIVDPTKSVKREILPADWPGCWQRISGQSRYSMYMQHVHRIFSSLYQSMLVYQYVKEASHVCRSRHPTHILLGVLARE